MSVKVMGLIWDHFPRGGGDLLTALCLADHADHEGGNVFPSVARIAGKTRQSERTIQRHIAAMKAAGWLVEVERASGTPGKATLYRIPIECIPQGVVGGVTKLHPSEGCHPRQERVTSKAKRGDTAMAPELGLPVINRQARSRKSYPQDRWWENDQAMLKKAKTLNIDTLGLSPQALRSKINEKLGHH